MEAPPVQPGCPAGNGGGYRGENAAEFIVAVHIVGPGPQNQREQSGCEHAADERQKEQDRGERHAPLRSEVERKAPRSDRDEQRSDERRSTIVERQPGGLTDGLPDPTDGEKQDRSGDRDKDVVEASKEPELLFVRNRGRALAFDVCAQSI